MPSAPRRQGERNPQQLLQRKEGTPWLTQATLLLRRNSSRPSSKNMPIVALGKVTVYHCCVFSTSPGLWTIGTPPSPIRLLQDVKSFFLRVRVLAVRPARFPKTWQGWRHTLSHSSMHLA